MTQGKAWNELADELGVAAVADGDPTRWYDELWSAGARGEVALPWDHDDPDPVLASWPGAVAGAGRRAVVVGCGLGADAEFLGRQGWDTTAFDISPAAVEAVRRRHPASPVTYREGNLLDLPDELVGAFDLVVEIFTVQALHPSLRERAVIGVRRLMAPGGRALVVQFVREDDEPLTTEPPWMLTRGEMAAIAGDGVEVESLDRPPVPEGSRRRWRLVLWRA